MKLANKFFVIIVFHAIFVSHTLAATKAWLIGSEKALKLNVETNIIENIDIPIDELEVFLDERRGNLFILYSPARFINEIAVYDVKTLKRKGKLDVKMSAETIDDVQILFPPSGNIFYLRWVKEEDGPPEIVAYDAITLKPLNRYTTTPSITNKVMLSAAGDLLYSIMQDENTRRIDIFQTSDFTYKSSIDIKQFISLGISGITTGYGREKVLISEVINKAPQYEYFEYIYDISSNKISPKMKTTIKGADFLIPKTNKIAIRESQYVGKFKSMRLSTDYLFTGNVYIFDATVGQKVATVQIPVGSKTIGDIIGISPLEDKLYVRTYNASGDQNPKLHIIDLKNYTVIKELPIPDSSIKMIFFEE